MQLYVIESCNLEEIDYFYFQTLENAISFAKSIIALDIQQYTTKYPDRKRTWDIKEIGIPASRLSAFCDQREWCINVYDAKFTDS